MRPGRSAASFAARWLGAWVTEVGRDTLRADLVAGLLGAVLVLPQGVAFATLAGLPPQYGLYSAVVPCAVAALSGSSRHVVSGPTNANSLALFAMLTPLAAAFSDAYVALALTVTVMVGVLQCLIGTLRLGTVANFISPAALLGFTGGSAALIAIHALKDLFGFGPMAGSGAPSVVGYAVTHLNGIHPGSLCVGLATISIALLVRRADRRWPHMLFGLSLATLVALGLNGCGASWRVGTIGTVPSPWPSFRIPQIDLALLPDLFVIACALTIVALGQSISIAKVVAARSGQRIDANREFVGQGLSNIVGGFFSSYLSCGSLNRSLPNLEAGARTPLAAVFSALLLLVLIGLSAPLFALIPMAAIAGLLLLVAWGLLDPQRWRRLYAVNRTEFGIAVATFAATVSLRLEIAILLGTVLSLVSYLHRTSRPAMRTLGFDTMAANRHLLPLDGRHDALPECPQLKLLRMEGSVYFGAAQHVTDKLHEMRAVAHAPKHLLVMARSMNFVDAAGEELWQTELAQRRAIGGDLYFHRPRSGVIELWERSRFIDSLGRDHIYADKRSAIQSILAQLDPSICAGCRARVFWECGPVAGASGVHRPSRAARDMDRAVSTPKSATDRHGGPCVAGHRIVKSRRTA